LASGSEFRVKAFRINWGWDDGMSTGVRV